MNYKSIISNTIPYLSLILFAILIFKPLFGEGYLIRSDNPPHYMEAHYLKYNLLSNLNLHGWYPYALAGIPVHIYTPILGYWILILLSSLPGISLNFAYKLIVLLSFVLPSIALYFLLTKFLPKFYSFVFSLALLFQHQYQAFILMGMWNTGIAFFFFIIFLYLQIKYKDYKPRNILIMSLLLAAIIISHVFIGVISVIILCANILIYHKTKINKKTLTISLIGIATFLLTIFYLSDFILTKGWPLNISGFGLGNSIGKILFTELGMLFSLKEYQIPLQHLLSRDMLNGLIMLVKTAVYNIPMLLVDFFGIIGIYKYLKNKKEYVWAKPVFLSFVILLIFGSGFWYLFNSLKSVPFINTLISYRFVYLARYLLAIFAVIGVINIIKSKKTKIGLIILFFLPLVLFHNAYTITDNESQTTQDTVLFDEMLKIIEWANINIDPETSRLYDESTYATIFDGSINPQNSIWSFSPLYTNLTFANGWIQGIYPTQQFLLMDNKILFNQSITNLNSTEVADYMQIYNIKHFISTETIMYNILNNSTLFKKEYSYGHFTIFNLINYEPKWAESEKNIIYKINFSTSNKVLLFVNNSFNDNITFKYSYHPYWHAKILETGDYLTINKNNYGLMVISLPKGDYTLELYYHRTRIYELISLFSLIIVLLLIFNNKGSPSKLL